MLRSPSSGASPIARVRVSPIVLVLAAALCASLLVALPATADGRRSGHDRFLATARVIDVRAVHTDVQVRVPRLECAPSRRPTRVDVYERPYREHLRGGYGRGYGVAYGHEYRRGVTERRAAVKGGLRRRRRRQPHRS